MKNPTLHDESNLNKSTEADNCSERLTFKLGLDVDLHNIVVANQCERGVIAPAQKVSRGQLILWVKE